MSTPVTAAGTVQDQKEVSIVQAGPVLSRNRFSQGEKLLLARLCVQHGGDFSVRGGRERFWLKIQQLFSSALGQPVCNPRSIMARMLADHNTKILREVKESGTAQTDGEYEQTMAQWKIRVESSGDGRGSGTAQKAKANLKKEKEEELAAAHRQKLLSTMQGKRSYQAAIAALDAHYMSEEEKEKKQKLSVGESLIDGSDEEGKETDSKEAVVMGPASQGGKREKTSETLRDKRRKIKERGKLLNASLAEDSSRLTAILERVATSLLPSSPTHPSRSSSPTTQSSNIPTASMPTSDMTETRFQSLEIRLEIAEKALEEVKGNMDEILRIVRER